MTTKKKITLDDLTALAAELERDGTTTFPSEYPSDPASGKKDAALARGIGVVCGHCQTMNTHNHSFFSVMDGISSPEAMVDMSAMRGFGGMGLTDHGTMGGVLRAGKAGKAWKTGRWKSSGKLFNYRDVELNRYVERYIPTTSQFARLRNEASVRTFLSNLPRPWLERHPSDSRRMRIISREERVIRQNDSLISDQNITAQFLDGSVEICDDDWRPIDLSEARPFVQALSKASVTHDPETPELFRILDKSEYEAVGDFKVVSGCELYVSWSDKRDAKYHHITVYATGEKGHRALVLLTSIGAIPSRRYIGARGFFRPRVFVEDIEVALGVADGELVVTTGCPISITSEALRRGDEAEARRFFEWGVRALPPGRFFAELHLCDVSLDWNPRFARADDKFFSSVFNTPISRFRHDEESTAVEYAKEFHRDLRLFSLGSSLRGYTMEAEGSARILLQEHHFDLSTPEGVALARANQTSGVVHPLIEAGITVDLRDIFTRDVIEKMRSMSDEILAEAEDLLAAATIAEDHEAGHSAGSSTASTPAGHERGKTIVKKLWDKVVVRVKGGKTAQLLDEDTLALLSAALKVVDASKRGAGVDKTRRPAIASAAMLARLAIFIITRVAREDSVQTVSPADVIRAFMSVPLAHALGAAEDAAILAEIATDRVLMLDSALSGALDDDIVYAVARALTALLRGESFGSSSPLAPGGGPEDGMEREWTVHPEGNWMETVNRGLVKLAKEYDVPLLMATDAHMTRPELKPVQDAVIKRGKRRGWHMSRPYAIPRSDLVGMVADLGADWTADKDYLEKGSNAALRMIDSDSISIEDIIESLGAGSLLLAAARHVGSFKWKTAVPRIRYSNHPFYDDAKNLLESGELKSILDSAEDITSGDIKFSDLSLNIASALLVVTFIRRIEEGLTPDEEVYLRRLFDELYLQQEVPNEQLADFFIFNQQFISRWRKRGVSVGPGRGSSGGMLSAQITGTTYGDPIRKGFLASRWMNRGRKAKGAMADIDTDVSDRQVAGYEAALEARDGFVDSIKERPLDPLEQILHAELFYSSAPVTHEVIGGMLREVARTSKDVTSGFASNIGSRSSVYRNIETLKPIERTGNAEDDNEIESDAVATIEAEKEDGVTVTGTPVGRVGTYGSLKAKAAVKEGVRIKDQTPYSQMPSFGDPPQNWVDKHRSIYLSDEESRLGITEDEKRNRMFEDERWGHLPHKERETRRRVKLGDRLTKEMAASAGLARLYQSELDYFMGSVYGKTPEYWPVDQRSPSGSPLAARYFDANPEVKRLVLDMLNIYKSQGVHAGGFVFGREVFERIPMRADKHGYVAQFEMKDIEAVGIMKFDILGLETLNQISQTLRFIVEEEPYESLKWWLPRDIYDRVKAGESADIMWHHMPLSTPEAVELFCRNRAMIFQIDTRVFGKTLEKLEPKAVLEVIKRGGDPYSITNDRLVDVLNAECALHRPGPMALNAHEDYNLRMMGQQPISTIHPWMNQFVSETFGLIVYQEQVMAIYRHGAIMLNDDGKPKLLANGSFILASEEETDEVRRAMGKKDFATLEKMRAEEKFIRGLAAQGLPSDIAVAIWKTITPFAEYGFNCPHSYHYGLISGVTLFLKAHYTKYFFRVTMGLANPNDASRFLSEIQRQTRTPCVLRSKELYWEVVGTEYFPGLASVEGLKSKDIHRILATQKICLDEAATSGNKVDAETFFKNLGTMTVAFATTLARSGALRVLGSPEEIAAGYSAAVINHLKPALARRKAEAKVTSATGQSPNAARDDSLVEEACVEILQMLSKLTDTVTATELVITMFFFNALQSEIGSDPKESLREHDFEDPDFGDLVYDACSYERSGDGDALPNESPRAIFDGWRAARPSTDFSSAIAKILNAPGVASVVPAEATAFASSIGIHIEQPKAATVNPQAELPKDLFDSLVFETLGDKAKADEDEDTDAPIEAKKKGRKPTTTKPRAVKLGKTDEKVIDILKSKGVAYVDSPSVDGESTSQVMTVESALDMVLANKTKGAGIRHLVAALAAEQKRTLSDVELRATPGYVMLKDLKFLRTDEGEELEADAVYRTVAIPKIISMGQGPNGSAGDPRITFVAEGTELNAKFSKKYDELLKGEQLTMLKDGKMSTPFIMDIFVGRFQPPDRNEMITYFKITYLEKMGAGD